MDNGCSCASGNSIERASFGSLQTSCTGAEPNTQRGSSRLSSELVKPERQFLSFNEILDQPLFLKPPPQGTAPLPSNCGHQLCLSKNSRVSGARAQNTTRPGSSEPCGDCLMTDLSTEELARVSVDGLRCFLWPNFPHVTCRSGFRALQASPALHSMDLTVTRISAFHFRPRPRPPGTSSSRSSESPARPPSLRSGR